MQKIQNKNVMNNKLLLKIYRKVIIMFKIFIQKHKHTGYFNLNRLIALLVNSNGFNKELNTLKFI